MKFENKQQAIAFINSSNVHEDEKSILADILEQHAIESTPVSIVGDENGIDSVLFRADHDVDIEQELGDIIVIVRCTEGACVTTTIKNTNTQANQTQESTMNNTNTATAADNVADVIEKTPTGRFTGMLAAVTSPTAKKLAAYAAGVTVVAGLGYYAWKKFGSGGEAIIDTSVIAE